MKASSATSAKAGTDATRVTGRSSARLRPTRTSAEDIALVGPSDLPDPAIHAFRKDLADVALAHQVIASHYAEPVERRLAAAATLRAAPAGGAEPLCKLPSGSSFLMLDDSLGWAWGYAGEDRRVGYLRSDVLGR